MKKDFYEVLGVSRDVSDSALKSAYRRLAKKYHPDANPGNKEAEQKFKEVGEAYAVLSDPEKRKLYDMYGMAAFDGTGGPGSYQDPDGFGGVHFDGGSGGSFRSFHFDEADAEDLFRSMFGDLFASSGSTSRGRKKKGAGSFGAFHSFGDFGSGFEDIREEDLNLKTSLTVSFREAALGCRKRIRLSSADSPGSASTLEITIPAGIDEGKQIRLKGKGHLSASGRTGDLLIEIHISPDSMYTRKGRDVYTTVEIPFATAVLGGEACVPTLYGDVICRIPEGTSSGAKIRLKGKGIRGNGGKDAAGDEYVEIRIAVPKNLTPAQKKKLREFDSMLAGSTRKEAS